MESVKIKIRNALKKYGNNIVIPDLSLDIEEGEFFTLLGPSGCGKTTLLRMIAGFNSIEGGDFFFNDVRINDLAAEKRNIGMVFQNYAIFPNMTVRNNVAFGLKTRKLPKEEIKAKTDKFLNLMKIMEYAERMPAALSGGQQQRVALARALAIEPNILLMDEPLSNLDAKLRIEMRSVIKEIQNKMGITTVYVTHDQEEAMAVSDRIAVMKDGVIQQIGTPKILYQRPANLFVSTFIGYTNQVEAKIQERDGERGVLFKDSYFVPMKNLTEDAVIGMDIIATVRPEEFVITDETTEGLSGVIDYSTFLGNDTHYIVKLESGERFEIVEESMIDDIIPSGKKVCLTVKSKKINLFTKDGSKSLVI